MPRQRRLTSGSFDPSGSSEDYPSRRRWDSKLGGPRRGIETQRAVRIEARRPWRKLLIAWGLIARAAPRGTALA
jgi:hypothetical protein